MNICVIWNSLTFYGEEEKQRRKVIILLILRALNSFVICFMVVPHDGNYIHSIFFSQTQITRCYQCFIFNSRSVDQKPEKSPQWKFNTFFHTEFWGLWFLRVKGYFMHGWSEGSDVKLTASVVYLGTTLFLSTCYSILAVMKWDLHRFS